MRLEPTLRIIAGVVVLASLALGYLASPYWHILTALAGLNLLQSGLTGWCPIMPVLRWLGATEGTCAEFACSTDMPHNSKSHEGGDANLSLNAGSTSRVVH